METPVGLDRVLQSFDDEALTRTMISVAAEGIGGLFKGAPPRVTATRDRVKALMIAAVDLREALEDLVLRCDGDQGVRADGSNIDTLRAHAVLQRLEEL